MIAIYTAGTFIRQLVGFVMLPIYTSYLGPADYGIISLLTLSISIFELVIGARFAQAIPRFYYEHDDENLRKTVLSTSLIITAFFSSIGFVIIFSAQKPLAHLIFGDSTLSIYLAIYGFLLFGSGIEYYGMTYLRLLERPYLFVFSSIAKLAVQLSLNIWLIVFLNKGVMGAIVSNITASALFTVIFSSYILYQCGFRIDKTLIVRLFRFSWPLWLAGAAALYATSCNRFFIRIYAGLDDVGLFELANRLAMIVGLVIWQPFSQWWQTERFKLLNNSTNKNFEFQRVFDFIAGFLFFSATGVGILGDTVIKVMADSAFHLAAKALLPLTYASVFYCLGLFFNFWFLASDKTIKITYIKYINAILLTAIYLAFIPKGGFVGAAYGLLAANVAIYGVTYLWSRHYLDIKISTGFMYKALGLSVAACAIDIFSGLSSLSLGWSAIAKTSLCTIYTLTLALFFYMNKSTKESLQNLILRVR